MIKYRIELFSQSFFESLTNSRDPNPDPGCQLITDPDPNPDPQHWFISMPYLGGGWPVLLPGHGLLLEQLCLHLVLDEPQLLLGQVHSLQPLQ